MPWSCAVFHCCDAGAYYVGWHATGAQSTERGIALDDIRFYQPGTCGAPSAVNVSAASGPTVVTLTCTVTGGFGGAPQYQWYTGASCATGVIIPGATAATYRVFATGNYACKVWYSNPATCSGCDSALATILPDPCLPGIGVTRVYLQDFSSSGLPSCWSVENGNHDAYQWTIAGQSYSAPYCAYMNASANPAQDWLFSEPMQLSAGITYHTEYWRRGVSYMNPQTLSLTVGTAPTEGAMTAIIAAPKSFNNTTYQRVLAEFTPPATNSYYFGILCATAGVGGGVYLDDFRVFPEGTCEAPDAVTVNSTAAPDSVLLSCVAVGGFGDAGYSYQWYTGPACVMGNEIPGVTNATYSTLISGTFSCLAYMTSAATCGRGDSATATVVPCASNPVTTWPYLESFESVLTPNLPDCWRQQDVNGDGRTWVGANAGPHFGVRSAFCTYSSAGTFPVDDWLFTPALRFVAGDTMVITYWYRQYEFGPAGDHEALALLTGLAARGDAMVYTVVPRFTFDNLAWIQDSVRFVVPVTGNYFLGWHSTSDTDKHGTVIDDITVYPSQYCEPPAVHVADASYPAFVTLTAVASGGFGADCQYQWYSGLTCDPVYLIAGATAATYTTTVSGWYSCKAWRTSAVNCADCDSAQATVLPPQPGETCATALPVTVPLSGASTVVNSSTTPFFAHCQAACGSGVSAGADVFYSLTLPGQPQYGCRKIAVTLVGTDPLLTVYCRDGQLLAGFRCSVMTTTRNFWTVRNGMCWRSIRSARIPTSLPNLSRVPILSASALPEHTAVLTR